MMIYTLYKPHYEAQNPNNRYPLQGPPATIRVAIRAGKLWTKKHPIFYLSACRQAEIWYLSLTLKDEPSNSDSNEQFELWY
jgi:hypothetical protein